jgi:pyridoxamine 5'-phosphate oxidase
MEMSNVNLDLTHIRREYGSKPLLEIDAAIHPVEQFTLWLNDYMAIKPPEPTAMVLSSVDEKGFPDSRVVLLKEVIDDHFIFFTNYLSHKSSQILLNPHVALNFYWPELNRQIRIRGRAKKTSDSVSDKYFLERPFESQCAAIASPQSHKVPSRVKLEELYQIALQKYTQKTISRPEYWGGFAIEPVQFEFWQGREQRLHDRLLYKKNGQEWVICRLAP